MIPSRTEAAAVLLDLSPSPRLLRHATAVAEVAAFLAEHIERRGLPVDRRLVESAALLHDLDKALPRNNAYRALGHGRAGARWLTEHGYQELAPAVADHPVVRLSDSGYPAWVKTASIEDRVVAYADKRAAQRLGHIDVRFERWYEQHPEYLEGLRLARQRAELLENEVCAAADVDPTEVGSIAMGAAPALDRAARTTSRGGPTMSASVAFFHGEDAWAIDDAVARFARDAGSPDAPLEVWRANPDEDSDNGTGEPPRRGRQPIGEPGCSTSNLDRGWAPRRSSAVARWWWCANRAACCARRSPDSDCWPSSHPCRPAMRSASATWPARTARPRPPARSYAGR